MVQKGGAGIGGGISPEDPHHYYGGMGIYENTDLLTIDGTTWQLVHTAGDWVTGLVNGLVFEDGATDVVSGAFADAGGTPNEVTVTCADHPFAALDIVSISGATSANYNKVHQIQSVTTHTFNIVSAFAVEAADAQVVTRSGNLTISNPGIYKVVYHCAIAPDNGNDIVDIKIWSGVTAGVPDALDMSESRHETFLAGKFSTVSGCDIFQPVADQKVSIGIKNISGANDVLFRYVHVSIYQL